MKIAGIIKSSLIDYPGKASTVVFLGGCNFRCGYCHNPELVSCLKSEGNDSSTQKASTDIEIIDFLNFIKTRKRFLDAVCISGGEPTLYGELPGLIEQIKKLDFSIKLDTNGSNPDMIKGLITERLVDYVAMDIKGPMGKYRSIVRHEVDTDLIKTSAEVLTEAYNNKELPCEFRTTVCRELLSFEDLKGMMAEHPCAPPWHLQRFVNPGRILDNGGIYSAYSIEEMETFGRELCASVR